MKLGLTKFGRAWGKVCREVGSSKTAMQCKRFYDENCGVDELGLNQALADHSSIKVHVQYSTCSTPTCVVQYPGE